MKMVEKIGQKPLTGSRVTRIQEVKEQPGLMRVEWEDKVHRRQHNHYSHVICTPPLGCVGGMNLQDANLLSAQKVAIRSLQYDASTKIGLKFASQWWQDPRVVSTALINGGQSKTDLPIRVCVYPSDGRSVPQEKAPGVLIASYTWAQDALRFGFATQSQHDSTWLEDVLNDVATIHGLTRDQLPPL
ncbi:Flavin containing amine oxidoreductase [Ceratobasidium sp. AG-Ba]|nr:Flavin containing amine oxidoreductase [Ceratobasidium sp. AG-Ba]